MLDEKLELRVHTKPATPTPPTRCKHRHRLCISSTATVFAYLAPRSSCNLVRRLPFGRDTIEICGSLHIYNYISFELSTLFGQPKDALILLAFMVHSYPRQSLGITSPLFSGYTISLSGRVSGEQRGGAAEILSRMVVDHEN